METLREVAAELHDCLNIKIWDEDNNLRPIVYTFSGIYFSAVFTA